MFTSSFELKTIKIMSLTLSIKHVGHLLSALEVCESYDEKRVILNLMCDLLNIVDFEFFKCFIDFFIYHDVTNFLNNLDIESETINGKLVVTKNLFDLFFKMEVTN